MPLPILGMYLPVLGPLHVLARYSVLAHARPSHVPRTPLARPSLAVVSSHTYGSPPWSPRGGLVVCFSTVPSPWSPRRSPRLGALAHPSLAMILLLAMVGLLARVRPGLLAVVRPHAHACCPAVSPHALARIALPVCSPARCPLARLLSPRSPDVSSLARYVFACSLCARSPAVPPRSPTRRVLARPPLFPRSPSVSLLAFRTSLALHVVHALRVITHPVMARPSVSPCSRAVSSLTRHVPALAGRVGVVSERAGS